VTSQTVEPERPRGAPLSAERRRQLGSLMGMLFATPALLIIIGVAVQGHALPVVFPADAPTTPPLELFVDSPISLAAMVVISLTLATLAIIRPTRLVAALVVAASVALVFFDVVQLTIQMAAGEPGLVILAIVVIALRVAATALGVRLVRP